MKKLTRYEKLRIAEITGVESFIFIGCDSALPCVSANEEGKCEDVHEFEISVYAIDHKHAVMLLVQAENNIMHEGIQEF